MRKPLNALTTTESSPSKQMTFPQKLYVNLLRPNLGEMYAVNGIQREESKNNYETFVKKEIPTEPEKKELQSEVTCVVCYVTPRSHLFTPCMHLCTCENCASYIVGKELGCPICRKSIQSSVKVYMS